MRIVITLILAVLALSCGSVLSILNRLPKATSSAIIEHEKKEKKAVTQEFCTTVETVLGTVVTAGRSMRPRDAFRQFVPAGLKRGFSVCEDRQEYKVLMRELFELLEKKPVYKL